jgi:hypothetical protein
MKVCPRRPGSSAATRAKYTVCLEDAMNNLRTILTETGKHASGHIIRHVGNTDAVEVVGDGTKTLGQLVRDALAEFCTDVTALEDSGALASVVGVDKPVRVSIGIHGYAKK